MQPETTTLPVNGQEKKKEPTPAEQWDQLAFSVIFRELAPKGFKKINSGGYRGLLIANSDAPGLPKTTVTSCQRIAAQLVRGFREKLKKQLQLRQKEAEKQSEAAAELRDYCNFWQLKRRRHLQKRYEHYRDQVGLLEILINELDNVTIK